MRLFIKILLFVLVILVGNVKVVSATITFPNVEEATICPSFHTEISKAVLKIIEDDWRNCCQSGNDLVDYRNWGISVAVVAARGERTD